MTKCKFMSRLNLVTETNVNFQVRVDRKMVLSD